MNLIHKTYVYLKECIFCLQAGVRPVDKINLALKTLAFHLNKRNQRQPRLIEACVKIGRLAPRLRMRDVGGDMFIFHEVLTYGVYQVQPKWLQRRPETIVDLGANIGLTSLFMASQYSSAKIVAVEPHPESAALLRHNLGCLGQRARVWEAAVSDHTGEARLNLANEAYNASLLRESARHVQVRAVSMNEILGKEQISRIDILKIDIEGAERNLLAHSPVWLKKVGFMMIEMHEGYGFPELTRDLEPAGLAVHRQGIAHAIAIRQTR